MFAPHTERYLARIAAAQVKIDELKTLSIFCVPETDIIYQSKLQSLKTEIKALDLELSFRENLQSVYIDSNAYVPSYACVQNVDIPCEHTNRETLSICSPNLSNTKLSYETNTISEAHTFEVPRNINIPQPVTCQVCHTHLTYETHTLTDVHLFEAAQSIHSPQIVISQASFVVVTCKQATQVTANIVKPTRKFIPTPPDITLLILTTWETVSSDNLHSTPQSLYNQRFNTTTWDPGIVNSYITDHHILCTRNSNKMFDPGIYILSSDYTLRLYQYDSQRSHSSFKNG